MLSGKRFTEISEAMCSSEMSVITFYSTQLNNPEDLNLYFLLFLVFNLLISTATG
jgi:hypothetical protein